MPAPFLRLTVAEFAERLVAFPFTRRVTSVHLHHTWRPNRAQWKGESTIRGMYDFHTRTNGWSDIAQHVTVDPTGHLWTGRDWNAMPASNGAAGDNGTRAGGPFMFEVLGDFDVGRDRLEGDQRWAVLSAVARVQLRFLLPPESLRFHRQLRDVGKTCPGDGLDYAATLAALRAERVRLADARPAPPPPGAPPSRPLAA